MAYAVSRRQIFDAIWALVSQATFPNAIMGSTTWKGKAKKFVDVSQIPVDAQPFLAQFEGYPEKYEYRGTGLPPVRWPGVRLWCWARVDSGDAAELGSDYLTDMLEAVELALAPQPGIGQLIGKQTLGGLVEWCRIEGTVLKVPGDLDGQALICIPVLTLWPN